MLVDYVNLQSADNGRTFYPADINSFPLKFFFKSNSEAEKQNDAPPFFVRHVGWIEEGAKPSGGASLKQPLLPGLRPLPSANPSRNHSQ
jgi:hypothetical protein